MTVQTKHLKELSPTTQELAFQLSKVLAHSGWDMLPPEPRLNATTHEYDDLLWQAKRDEYLEQAATPEELLRRCWRLEDIGRFNKPADKEHDDDQP